MINIVNKAISGLNERIILENDELLWILTRLLSISSCDDIEAIIGKIIHTPKWFTIQNTFYVIFLNKKINCKVSSPLKLMDKSLLS